MTGRPLRPHSGVIAGARDVALRALPVIAMLLIAAAGDKKGKGGLAVWIALAAVFIALSASAATRLTKGSRPTKGTPDSGSDAIASSHGSADSHHGGHHPGHSDHGGGADGGGADGGGADGGGD